jgi:hypothetical protein
MDQVRIMTDPIFPTGKFTYTAGGYSPVMNIFPGGDLTISLNGKVIVVSKYRLAGNFMEIDDLQGSHAGPEYGVGRYQWQYDGDTITFKLIEDKLPPRLKAFAAAWRKVEPPEMPYFMEGNQP